MTKVRAGIPRACDQACISVHLACILRASAFLPLGLDRKLGSKPAHVGQSLRFPNWARRIRWQGPVNPRRIGFQANIPNGLRHLLVEGLPSGLRSRAGLRAESGGLGLRSCAAAAHTASCPSAASLSKRSCRRVLSNGERENLLRTCDNGRASQAVLVTASLATPPCPAACPDCSPPCARA